MYTLTQGAALLAERPAPMQGVGLALFLVGAVTFLYPASFPLGQAIGLVIAVSGLLANAGASLLGRSVNRAAAFPAVAVTLKRDAATTLSDGVQHHQQHDAHPDRRTCVDLPGRGPGPATDRRARPRVGVDDDRNEDGTICGFHVGRNGNVHVHTDNNVRPR